MVKLREWPRDGLVQGLEQSGAKGSAIWGARLGSEGSPRRGEAAKGHSRAFSRKPTNHSIENSEEPVSAHRRGCLD